MVQHSSGKRQGLARRPVCSSNASCHSGPHAAFRLQLTHSSRQLDPHIALTPNQVSSWTPTQASRPVKPPAGLSNAQLWFQGPHAASSLQLNRQLSQLSPVCCSSASCHSFDC